MNYRKKKYDKLTTDGYPEEDGCTPFQWLF